MKKITFLVLALLLSIPALAGDGKDHAIDAFKDNKAVKKTIRELMAKKVDDPKAILIGRMANGCSIRESYLVSQEIATNITVYATTVAARVEVSIQDLACLGKDRGRDIDARVVSIVDLDAVTRQSTR
jgi:hypothetical protein